MMTWPVFSVPIPLLLTGHGYTAGMISAHPESPHRSHRAGWLRAAVLGANDGTVSIAGLLVGVAAGGASSQALLAAGVAGTVAGAMSMAAGEYVSVKSQADVESADLEQERIELQRNPGNEQQELARIYQARGLSAALAAQVAQELSVHDALASHARDELGISEQLRARPVQAALSSAIAFVCGALLPLLVSVLVAHERVIVATGIATVAGLALAGSLAAWLGGAPVLRGALRVTFWGALAMLLAGLAGRLFQLPLA